jgi:prefoldin subunit 5
MENEQKKSTSGKVYYILLIILLLASNGVFIYNYFTTDKKLVQTTEELFATDSAKAELQNILSETESELEIYKGKNEELDAFLKQKTDSLQEFAQRINVLLRQNRLNRSQLDSVLVELDQLRYYKRKYLNQIDSLSTQLQVLTKENTTLKGVIDKEKRKYEDLNMENIRLNNKVAVGAKLNAKAVTVTGVRSRSGGKEKETMRVSQLERLKISIELAENYVADIGTKEMYVKVIGPDGSTLYNEQAGSGTFAFEGQQSLYSTKKSFEFNQEAQTVIIYWDKGSEFVKGNYKVDLFCDGLRIGSGEFELK